MLKLKPYAHYLIMLGLALLLTAVGQLVNPDSAWAGNERFQTLPTPTPVGGGGGGGGGGSALPQAKILGTVTDLSTGRAGAGIVVKINDVTVTTDSFGDYSLSNVAAGEYVVDLVLTGDAVAAQAPVTVYVDGTNNVTVNLDYYSVPPADGVVIQTVVPQGGVTPTAEPATPEAAAAQATVQTTPVVTATVAASADAAQPQATATTVAPSPAELPPTGAVKYTWWILFLAGAVFLAAGLKLSARARD